MREELNRGNVVKDASTLREFTLKLIECIEKTGRDHPIPTLSKRKLAQLEAEAAKVSAIAEQEREEKALHQLKKPSS